VDFNRQIFPLCETPTLLRLLVIRVSDKESLTDTFSPSRLCPHHDLNGYLKVSVSPGFIGQLSLAGSRTFGGITNWLGIKSSRFRELEWRECNGMVCCFPDIVDSRIFFFFLLILGRSRIETAQDNRIGDRVAGYMGIYWYKPCYRDIRSFIPVFYCLYRHNRVYTRIYR
jgi:hypothetical protein